MKIKPITAASATFLACILVAFALAFTVSHAFADVIPSPVILDDSVSVPGTAPAVIAAVPSPAPVAAGDLLSSLGLPSWLVTGLSIFATVSLAYQALIAFAHKRAAETADVADDKWLASLDAQPWFRILDRVFYWGGYLGSRLGNRKL